MDWGNSIVRKRSLGPSGDVTAIEADLFLEGDFKKTKKKITWLPSDSPLVDVTLLDYDYLITKKKLEEDDDVADFVTPQTEFRVEALADANVAELKQGDIIQFERKGYYILDKVQGDFAKGDLHLEFISIPDGRAGGVASKAGTAPVDLSAPPVVKKSTTGGWGKNAPSGVQAPTKTSNPNENVMLSEGTQGFKIPVTTTMYSVDPVVGDVEAEADTKMYKVDNVYDHSK
jgi:glutamyl-tRNA synthetase